MDRKAYRKGWDGIDWSVKAPPVETKPVTATRSPRGYVVPDIAPFVEPINGTVIEGRRQRRDFCRAHGVIDVGDERVKPAKRERPPVGPDIRRAIQELESR